MQDSKRDTDVKNKLLDSVGEGQGGMIWENGIEICIISYMKQVASPGSMHEAGCSGLVALGWPWGMGWGGRWKEVQDGEHMYTHDSFMSMYGKTHHNTVKELASN